MSLASSFQYAREYRRAQTDTASPAKLVVMLYDGAVRFTRQARERMRVGDTDGQATNILKTQRIITELLNTLNVREGGEMAVNLSRLYAYMLRQLAEANSNRQTKPLDEVITILTDLRESWAEVERTQQAKPARELASVG